MSFPTDWHRMFDMTDTAMSTAIGSSARQAGREFPKAHVMLLSKALKGADKKRGQTFGVWENLLMEKDIH